MFSILEDPTRSALRAAMDACATRNGVIADNIANADTPGYQRQYVRFEDMLSQALTGSHDSDTLKSVKPVVETSKSASSRLDGNNVNLDTEMSDLAKNSIEYNALVELNRMKGQMVSVVIRGGK